MSACPDGCNLHDFFATERKLLLLAGFYPRRKDEHKHLYFLSGFINLIISYSQLLTMVLAILIEKNDLLTLTGTLLYFFTQFTFICKLLNFQHRDKDLLEIEDFLTDSTFCNFSSNQLNIIERKIRWCDVIARAYRSCVFFTVGVYSLVPLVDTNKRNNLPLPGWFPYDTARSYTETYIFQIISVIISAYCNTSIDILTWKLASLASAQFEILKENLRKIDFKYPYGETRLELIKCLVHHHKSVGLVKRIENVFSKGMFLQLFCSIGVICTNGFQLVLIPIPSTQFAFSLFYLCGMTFQIAAYCWYGHDVIITSEKIGESLYASNWYECHFKIRKILVVFFENVKKPVLFKAGGFFVLSMKTFTQIMRSAYSYYAVLERLYNDS